MFSKLTTIVMTTVATLLASTALFAVSGDVYLGTFSDKSGFLSRGVFQFHGDGTLIVSDSSQQGENNANQNFPPFGIQHGYWVQENDNILKLKTVDFNYPKFLTTDFPEGFGLDQSLVVSEITLKRNCNEKKYHGKVKLSFFPIDRKNINTSEPLFTVNAGTLTLDIIIEKP